MKISFTILTIISTIINLSAQTNNINIIPRPQGIKILDGYFTINSSTKILCDEDTKMIAEYFSNEVESLFGIKPNIRKASSDKAEINVIVLRLTKLDHSNSKEAYHLNITKEKITITATEPNGIFYGIQSLRQLLPVVKNVKSQNELLIPAVDIKDYPRFVHRGLNLDCCRHFMEKDFVKRYIDLLAYHKMNVLHWHLTEDQGWRIEIKKYPELTRIGAFRKYDDGTEYGGFYTQEDIKEVVEYAASRFITVIPEIELPGHSTAAIATYPQYSCTGGPFNVGTLWGVYKDIYCAGNDDTFKFLEDVLSEVIDLFPGPYIHIGGDEAPKDRWKVCPKCQQRIKDEGLADEHELQSYFVKRIEKFVNSKGKRIIGWDEILEGGLAPEATVQSWQGTKGAIDAAKMGHDVIVSPTSHCYYDYPIETTDVPKVYSFDPVPPELNAEEIKHVLGTEGNMWTEYAPQNVIDHRLFPRIVALSEGGWTELKHKNYADFNKRLQNHYDKLDELDVNYAFEVSSVKTNLVFNKDKNEFVISLENQQPQFDLYYTIDGAEPTISSTKYSEPIKLNKSATLKMALYRGDKKVGYTIEKDYTISKSQNKKVELTYPYSAVIPLLTGPIKLIWGLKSQSIFGVQLYERFTGGGDFALTDGVRGTSSYRDGLWQVFGQTDFEAVVDLEKATDINKIIIGFFTASSSLVVFPEYVEFFTSDDKENYRSLGKISKDFSLKDPSWIKKDFSLGVDNVSARYVKIFAKNPLTVPDWHPAAGRRVWLMVDEIIIE